MNPHFSLPQMMLFFGGAVFVVTVLVLAVYLLQKFVKRGLRSGVPKPDRVRVDDEAAFMSATLKSLIAQLKNDQKVIQEKLGAAERRAELNQRKFDLLAREVDFGLMIIDVEGYIAFSNPRVRQALAVDTWSHRRYGEIFHDTPNLAQLIGQCVATGSEARKTLIEYRGADGTEKSLEVSILPARNQAGAVEVVACVFREPGTRGM